MTLHHFLLMDGQQLLFDNSASDSITLYIFDFQQPPMPIQCKVKDIGWHAQAMYKGTVQCKVQHDQGHLYHFILLNM